MTLKVASQLDHVITGGFILLIVLIPLTVDPGDPSAFSPMEALIFLLVPVWMAKVLLREVQFPSLRGPVARAVGLLVLFSVFRIVQLIPFPPSVGELPASAPCPVHRKTLPA